MPIKHRMSGADRRSVHIGVQASQPFLDLRSTPARLVLLEADDQRLDLHRQLIGVAVGPARSVGQALDPRAVVSIEDLVAGLARHAEIAADARHLLPIEQPGDELQAFAAFQVADTRLTTPHGALRSDSAVKTIVLQCVDAKLLFSYTGIAAVRGTATDQCWPQNFEALMRGEKCFGRWSTAFVMSSPVLTRTR